MKTFKYFVEAIIIYFLFLITKIIGIYLARRIISYLFLFFGFLFKSKKIVKGSDNDIELLMKNNDSLLITGSLYFIGEKFKKYKKKLKF